MKNAAERLVAALEVVLLARSTLREAKIKHERMSNGGASAYGEPEFDADPGVIGAREALERGYGLVRAAFAELAVESIAERDAWRSVDQE